MLENARRASFPSLDHVTSSPFVFAFSEHDEGPNGLAIIFTLAKEYGSSYMYAKERTPSYMYTDKIRARLNATRFLHGEGRGAIKSRERVIRNYHRSSADDGYELDPYMRNFVPEEFYGSPASLPLLRETSF